MNGSLVPFFAGLASRYAYALALPRLMLLSSARYIVSCPAHVPPESVTTSGEMRPSPKLVSSRRRTAPLKPVTTSPFGSMAVIV